MKMYKQICVLLSVIVGVIEIHCSESSSILNADENKLLGLQSSMSECELNPSKPASQPIVRKLICTLWDSKRQVRPINIFGVRYYDSLILEAKEVYPVDYPPCDLARLHKFESTGSGNSFCLTGEREDLSNLGDVIERFLYSNPTKQINLSYAHCEKSFIHNVNLNKARLRCARFDQAILHSSDLSGTSLQNASLRCADLGLVNFSGADATEADFSGANLSGATFSGANVTGAIFFGSRILGADLAQGKFYGVIGLNLTGAIIVGRYGEDDTICEGPTHPYLNTEK